MITEKLKVISPLKNSQHINLMTAINHNNQYYWIKFPMASLYRIIEENFLILSASMGLYRHWKRGKFKLKQIHL